MQFESKPRATGAIRMLCFIPGGSMRKLFSSLSSVILAVWLLGVAIVTTVSPSIRAAPNFRDAVGEAVS